MAIGAYEIVKSEMWSGFIIRHPGRMIYWGLSVRIFIVW